MIAIKYDLNMGLVTWLTPFSLGKMMGKFKKIESQYYYAKRNALLANENWEITFKEWLAYALDNNAVDILTR